MYYSRHVATAFCNKRIEKAMMQFFGVWFLKLKQQGTRVNYNKDWVIQWWAEERKKRKETKKAKQKTNWICFSFTEAMEESKNRKAAYHIDCKFLVRNWFMVKSVIGLLTVRRRKLRLWLFCNLQYYEICSITKWNPLQVFFQRIRQNFKIRKQEILILKCFRSSSLSALRKIGVLKTSAKFLGKHIYRRLFSKTL